MPQYEEASIIPGIEAVKLHVRDFDYEWFRDVLMYLDRDLDLFHFSRISTDRLGELDEYTGNNYLIDCRVETKSNEIVVDCMIVLVWSVDCGQLIVRPETRSTA